MWNDIVVWFDKQTINECIHDLTFRMFECDNKHNKWEILNGEHYSIFVFALKVWALTK